MLPPATRMSVNAPPFTEISRTAPSYPMLPGGTVASRFHDARNFTVATLERIVIGGESRTTSLRWLETSAMTRFGDETAPDATVWKALTPPGPSIFVEVQPEGRAGAVTPSKFSANTNLGTQLTPTFTIDAS